jgi:hypothetical protein
VRFRVPKRLAPLVAVALLLAGCSGGQEAPEQEATPATGSVRGVIVDPAIRPLAANVTLSPGGLAATTGSDGSFSFEGLAPGAYLVGAEAAGHIAAQTTATVAAGAPAEVQFILLPVERDEATFETIAFDGFVQASAGLLTPLAAQAAGDTAATACTCTFEARPQPGLSRMVLEAAWEDTVADPTGPTEYAWRVAATGANATAQGTGASPLREVLSRLDFPAEGFDFAASPSYQVSLYPDATWPAYQQPYKAYLSLWYRGPPPEGWRVIA